MIEVINIFPSEEDIRKDKYVNEFRERGSKSIDEVFERLFEQCKKDHGELTELVIALDHLMWKSVETNNKNEGMVYLSLRQKAWQWADENLGEKELDYFYQKN